MCILALVSVIFQSKISLLIKSKVKSNNEKNDKPGMSALLSNRSNNGGRIPDHSTQMLTEKVSSLFKILQRLVHLWVLLFAYIGKECCPWISTNFYILCSHEQISKQRRERERDKNKWLVWYRILN